MRLGQGRIKPDVLPPPSVPGAPEVKSDFNTETAPLRVLHGLLLTQGTLLFDWFLACLLPLIRWIRTICFHNLNSLLESKVLSLAPVTSGNGRPLQPVQLVGPILGPFHCCLWGPFLENIQVYLPLNLAESHHSLLQWLPWIYGTSRFTHCSDSKRIQTAAEDSPPLGFQHKQICQNRTCREILFYASVIPFI